MNKMHYIINAQGRYIRGHVFGTALFTMRKHEAMHFPTRYSAKKAMDNLGTGGRRGLKGKILKVNNG